jgi:competence protein ComEC
VQGAVDRARERAENAITAALPPARAALVRGMVLGQDERIDPLVREDFRDSGLAHLLAVSGQNVMLLAALALPLLVLLRLGPAGRVACLLALIAVYVPLAGAGPSLQRAAAMGAAGIVALALARPASRSYALLLAAAVTLALAPRAAGDPGWQLSFAAVAGLIWIEPVLLPWLGGLPRLLARGVAITVAATLATAPLLAHHFGSLPVWSLAANVLALPAVPLAMWGGMLLCAAGQAGGAGADWIGAATAPALGYISWLARTTAELPGAEANVALGSWRAVAGAYAALAGVVLLARRRAERDEHERPRPTRGRSLRARRAAVATAVLAGVAAAVLAATLLHPPAPPGRATVTFLDVGQGDATLIRHPGGAAVLFDGGPPEARVYRLVKEAGVRRLSAVVATHASRDHHGGLLELVERVPVDLVLDGGDGTADPGFNAVLRRAEERGARIVAATAPLALRIGGIGIEVLAPAPRDPGPAPEDPNERAVVALVRSEGLDLFLSADAESASLAPLALPDIDVMKVPHHGSADPGLPQVLERLRPEAAVVEVGENSYGHPAPSTLAALRDARVPVFRTDRDGSVTVGADLAVATER